MTWSEMKTRVGSTVTGLGRWLVWRPWRLAVLVLVLIVVAGIARTFSTSSPIDEGGTPSPSLPGWPSSSAQTTPASPPSSPATPATSTAPPVSPSAAPSAVWDETSRQAAVDTGIAAVVAYTSGDQAVLDALLCADITLQVRPAAVTITTADSQFPGGSVPHILSETSPLTTMVIVPTSAGDYQVSVVRTDGTSPWLVQHIITSGT